MLSTTTPVTPLLFVCVSVFLTHIDARPTKNISTDDKHTLLDVLRDPIDITDYRLIDDTDFSDDRSSLDHIWKNNDKGDPSHHRTKRIGIAGLENIDLIMQRLGNNRNRPPRLSVTGDMSDLQRLMNNMRNNG